MRTAENTTLQKSPKAKKIEDIVKPDATMRLHQRLFDRRRKHHIEIKEENAISPGASLSAYLIPARYRRTPKAIPANQALVTTAPVPVVRYSEITREVPAENYLTAIPNYARSFMDRVAQRYHVFVSQHKPLYYSLGSGTASGWLKNPRARIALAGSALALLMFFVGSPSQTPTGPDNPAGRNPIVIEDTSRGSNNTETAQQATPTSNNSGTAAPSASNNTIAAPSSTPTPQPESTPSMVGGLTNGGGYGSGPATTSTTPSTTQTSPQTTTQNPSTTDNLIQDIIKPTPITVPGQDIQVDDKRILQTSDTTITIN